MKLNLIDGIDLDIDMDKVTMSSMEKLRQLYGSNLTAHIITNLLSSYNKQNVEDNWEDYKPEKRKKQYRWSNKEWEYVKNNYGKRPVKEIAERLGKSIQSVYNQVWYRKLK